MRLVLLFVLLALSIHATSASTSESDQLSFNSESRTADTQQALNELALMSADSLAAAEVVDVPAILSVAAMDLHEKRHLDEHEHHNSKHESHRSDKHDREEFEDESNPSDITQPEQPQQSQQQGQQYYSQYYNPSTRSGGQGGYDYSQYYNPQGGAASDPIHSGAEGSSSNIRASGEMAQGFIPGNKRSCDECDEQEKNKKHRSPRIYNKKEAEERKSHRHRHVAEVQAAMTTVLSDIKPISEVSTQMLKEKHQGKNAESEKKHHHHGNHKSDKDKDGAEDEPSIEEPIAKQHVPTQQELNAKWQQIGQQYARAFIPVQQPPAGDPTGPRPAVGGMAIDMDDEELEEAAAINTQLSTHTSSKHAEQLQQREQPQQPQQPMNQKEQRDYWKSVGESYRQAYAPPQNNNDGDFKKEKKHRRHHAASANLNLDSESRDFLSRDPDVRSRADRKVDERNEEMAKEIREHNKEVENHREVQSSAAARTTILDDDLALSDSSAVLELTASSDMTTFWRLFLIILIGTILLVSLWLIWDYRSKRAEYREVGDGVQSHA